MGAFVRHFCSARSHHTAMANIPSRSEEEERQAALRTSAALEKGELPHNPELDIMLERAAASLQKTQVSGNLSAEGQRIAQDATAVVTELKTVVDEKNRDEHLQKMHLHSKEAAKAAGKHGGIVPLPGQLLSGEEGKQAGASIRQLAQLIVTDTELRSILWDMGQLLRELFGETHSMTQAAEAMTSTRWFSSASWRC